MAEKALVIVPTYNEKENVERIIAAALAADARVEVLIVDDNSPDGTGDIVERLRRLTPELEPNDLVELEALLRSPRPQPAEAAPAEDATAAQSEPEPAPSPGLAKALATDEPAPQRVRR